MAMSSYRSPPLVLFFLMPGRPPRSTLFPPTPLFRSPPPSQPTRRRRAPDRRLRLAPEWSGLRRLATTARRACPAGASRALPAECGIDLRRQLVEIGGHADLATPAAWNALAGRLGQRHKAGDP